MSNDQRREFEERLKRVRKDHRTGANVRKAQAGSTKKHRRRRGFRFPWLFFVIAAAGYVFIKGFLYSYMGEQAYTQRLVDLASGDRLSQLGAGFMAADPASVWVAGQLEGVVALLKAEP